MNRRWGLLGAAAAAALAVVGGAGNPGLAATPAAGNLPTLQQSMSPDPLGVPIGGTALARATVKNAGKITATHVHMHFYIQSNDSQHPSMVGFSSTSITQSNGLVGWAVGTLAPGQSAILYIRVKAPARTVDSQLNYDTGADGIVEVCDNHSCLDHIAIETPVASAAYLFTSRAKTAVYVNGLIKQHDAYGWVRSPNRTVYLQRYLAGKWQTMLARTSNTQGLIAVGFVQTTRYEYRLFVAAAPTAAAAQSATSTR